MKIKQKTVTVAARSISKMAESQFIFRKAESSDLEEICCLYKAAISHMYECGMYFWSFDVYPTEEDLTNDVKNKNMFCAIDSASKKIAACIVLSTVCDEQYNNADWKYVPANPIIVHRLCVHPEFQNKGLGKTVMNYADTWAKQNGYNVIRLDAFSGNAPSLTMYNTLGFRKAGEANWVKGLFYLFEKRVQ